MNLFGKKKSPHQRPCPRCNVEDERNGIFCYNCGAQIIQTAVLRPSISRGKTKLFRQLKGLLISLVVLSLPFVVLWFFGSNLPFDPIFITGIGIVQKSGQSSEGSLVARIPSKAKGLKLVTTFLLTPPKTQVTLKVFEQKSTKARWHRQVHTDFLFYRMVEILPKKGEASLSKGKYVAQLSHKSSILGRLTFIVD